MTHTVHKQLLNSVVWPKSEILTVNDDIWAYRDGGLSL